MKTTHISCLFITDLIKLISIMQPKSILIYSRTAEGKKSAVRIVSSTLKIRNLDVLDKGFYTCEAVSQGDRNKISSTAILDVRRDAGMFLTGILL